MDERTPTHPTTADAPSAAPSAAPPAAPPADLTLPEAPARTVPVLVVDDDGPTRVALRAILEDAGYTVQEAGDGLLAMQALLSSTDPVVVLLDLMMPRMSGFEIVELFVNDPVEAQRVAFVVLTASISMEAYERLQPQLQLLGAPLLRKPFDIDELLDAVAAAASRLPPPGK